MISYWNCIIAVDIPEYQMPAGADLPMRDAVGEAAEKLHPKAKVLSISSGWGLSESGVERVQYEARKSINTISIDTRFRRDNRRRPERRRG